jgi:hypothetical protein
LAVVAAADPVPGRGAAPVATAERGFTTNTVALWAAAEAGLADLISKLS